MAATLIVVWVWTTGAVSTQNIPMVNDAACQKARAILERVTQPLIIDGGYLMDARFDCRNYPDVDQGHNMGRG